MRLVDTSILKTGLPARYLTISPLGIMLPLSRCGRWLSRKRFSALAQSRGVPRRNKWSGIES